MKNNHLSRRDFLLTALGTSGLAAIAHLSASPAIAFADDLAFEAEVAKHVPHVPITGVESVDASNRAANEAWERAVRQALAEGEKIVSLSAADFVSSPASLARAYYSPYCKVSYTVATFWKTTVGYTATYQVLNNDIQLSSVMGVTSYLIDGAEGATVTLTGVSYALIDSKRTLGVHYSSLVSFGNTYGGTQPVPVNVYVEFYYNGKCTRIG